MELIELKKDIGRESVCLSLLNLRVYVCVKVDLEDFMMSLCVAWIELEI